MTSGNPHHVTKSDIGLGSVDNTSDLDKPISTATQTALDGKVDKVAGKGLSANDYTTAEKTKLDGIEPCAEVNEVSAEQYARALGNISLLTKSNDQLKTALTNLIAGLSVPLTMTMSGTKGYVMIEDAASGSVSAITVDSSLSGTTLYIQIRDVKANTMQSVISTVNSTGNVPVSNLTVTYGTNEVYIAKKAYVWDNNVSHAIGWDGYPTDGVDFTITYSRDKDLGIEVDKGFLSWDEFREICGIKVTRIAYESASAAAAFPVPVSAATF